MIYRFVMVSDEVADFLREIRIDGTATFRELHDAIIESAGYSNDQLSSFFVSDKQWRPKQEILLMDMGAYGTDEDYYLMDKTYLDDFLEDEGDRILFQFDQLGDRYFYIELKEVILGEQLDHPLCSRKKGNPPVQTSEVEELLAAPPKPKAMVLPRTDKESDKESAKEEELDDFDAFDFDISELDVDGFDFGESDEELDL
ncbi:MAG: hypothetical protein Q4E10_03035 [Porphyromonas sp.]|nr:hypothetical protein [Porphyromonas sp.]